MPSISAHTASSGLTSAFQADAFQRAPGKAVSVKPSMDKTVQDRLSATLDALKRGPEELREAAQERARQKVELVREQLKLIKELYAENPKEMAKALRHLVKELKAALKDYKEAGGNPAQMQGAMMGAIASQTAPPSSLSQQDRAIEAEAGSQPSDPALSENDPSIQSDAVEQEPVLEETSDVPERVVSGSLEDLTARQGRLKGDEEFLNTVDGLSKKIRELFETAKIKAHFQAQDKARQETFKALGEELDELEEDVFDGLQDTRSDLNAVTLEIKLIERGQVSLPALPASTGQIDIQA